MSRDLYYDPYDVEIDADPYRSLVPNAVDELLDVHRKIGHFVSFGYGAHHCPGAALARLEGRIALDEVLDRFPEWEIDTANPRRSPTSTVRGWDSMPAIVG